MKTLTIWLLSGALVASLQWNLRGVATEDHGRELDPASLGLTAEQASELDRLCRSECATADELEAQADAKLVTLRRKLADPELDEEELNTLVREISDLRERSLAASVGSIVRVRAILDEDQVEKLLETCCRVDSCDTSACGR